MGGTRRRLVDLPNTPTMSEGDTISEAEDYDFKYAIKKAGTF